MCLCYSCCSAHKCLAEYKNSMIIQAKTIDCLNDPQRKDLGIFFIFRRYRIVTSKGGVVMEAHHPHCYPSNVTQVWSSEGGSSVVLVPALAPERFSPDILQFTLLSSFSLSTQPNFIRNGRRRTTLWICDHQTATCLNYKCIYLLFDIMHLVLMPLFNHYFLYLHFLGIKICLCAFAGKWGMSFFKHRACARQAVTMSPRSAGSSSMHRGGLEDSFFLHKELVDLKVKVLGVF